MSNIGKIANASALLPIRGVCYEPTPSDDTAPPLQRYFDSDYANSDFPLLWGKANSGRGDVANLAGNVGVNFLHLYNWSVPPAPGTPPGPYQRNHLPFLDECHTHHVKVFVPISNYFLEQIHQGNGTTVATQISAMVTEIYDNKQTPHAAAGIWGIGNEFDLAGGFTVNDVVTAIQYLIAAEQALDIPPRARLPITAPVSFADPGGANKPGIVAIQNLQAAFVTAGLQAVWTDRFIASVNPFNDGAYLKTYIDNIFPTAFPDLPFFFTEMGSSIPGGGGTVTDEHTQAKYVLSQLHNSAPRANFMGTCVFQDLDQSAVKTGTEATFGMSKYVTPLSYTHGTIPSGYTPGGGETYRVDTLQNKPLYDSVKTVYKAT